MQQQRPNRTVLGFTPYLWFYQIGDRLRNLEKVQARIERTRARYQRRLDKVEDQRSARAVRLRTARDERIAKHELVLTEGNWLMRNLGEPPSIFDVGAMANTARQMQAYMFNKGYFDGRVNPEVDSLARRRVAVTYRIYEGLPQKIRRVQYVAFDSLVQHITDSLVNQTGRKRPQIRPGLNYDQDLISAERERLDEGIRNSGYYNFSRDYIFVQADTGVVDSALGNRAIDLVYRIKNPSRGDHERYRVGAVDFYVQNTGGFARDDTVIVNYNNVTYHTPYRRLSFKTLDSKILERPGDYYNLEVLNQSQAQMQAMDMFRFVNFSFDSMPGNRHRLNIIASRLPKYQVSDEIGMLVSQGAPGPFANVGLKIRNGLNLFDVFELSARYSQEGQINVFNRDAPVYRAQEIGFNAALSFPAIVFPGYISYLFNRNNPRTRFQIGYTDVSRPEYTRRIPKATYTYTINLSRAEIIGLNLIDLSIIQTPRIDPGFRDYLLLQQRSGINLLQSFNNSVVSSLSAFYTYNTSSTIEKVRGVYWRVFGEWGGEIPHLLSRPSDPDPETGEVFDGVGPGGRLKVFRFTRVQNDFRYYLPTSRSTMWVGRIHNGVGIPLFGTNVLPWEKFFFSGGNSSIRAWPTRRLGPGSFQEPLNTDGRFVFFEQPGEVLLELNLELRQKLIGFLEGALFLDAGNVWNLPARERRPGADFRLNRFYQELALGSGVGIRLDFSFLVVRLDAGIKTYDPGFAPGERWVIKDFRLRRRTDGYQQTILNIGIGYPF